MIPLTNSKDCEAYLRHIWAYGTINYEERLYVVFLDNNGIRINHLDIYEGKQVECRVPLKKILKIRKRAKKLKSKHIVIAHNHPSGDCRPSDFDITATNVLIDTLFSEFNIIIIDHLILTEHNYFSFKDSGLIQNGLKATG